MQTRRTFAALTAGAGFAPGKRPLEQWKPGIKISLQLPGDPSDEDLAFVRQLGLRFVNIPSGGAAATPDNLIRLRQKAEAAGLKVFKSGNRNVHNMPEVTLDLPGRDEKIEEYKQYLRNLASAGICYTTYAHMGNGIWSSQREATPGGALARAFDLRKNPKGVWRDKTFEGPLTHGRRYSEREIWDNYVYFIRRITPVAEELGIRIGIHPDDPPGEPLGGVPRCIFSSFEGYRQALEIASNPNVGLCLCCGCRLEGGPRMGKGPEETIRYFARLGKLFKVHFRNASAPLLYFVETFMDTGYGDMYRTMRTLVEVDFRGCAIADHVPSIAGCRNAGWAYSIACMKAYRQRALAQAGKGRSRRDSGRRGGNTPASPRRPRSACSSGSPGGCHSGSTPAT